LASAFLVLTHEAMAAFFPYVLTPLFLDARRTWRGALAISAGPVAAAFLCSVLAVTHPGGKKASVMICNTVQTMTHDHNPHLCDGAVRAVGMSPREAHEEVDSYYRSYHYSELYGIAGLLSLLPVIAAVLWIQNPRQRWIVICAAALAGVASVPLFLYAVDWGRWIYIHALCCTLLVLRCAMLRNTTGQKEEGSQREPPAEWVWTGRRRAIAFSLAVYATCWTLPFCGQFPSHFGYLSLGQFARNYLRIHGARHPGVSMGVVAPQTSPSGSTPASSGSTRR
jgi:hypothetical protein